MVDGQIHRNHFENDTFDEGYGEIDVTGDMR